MLLHNRKVALTIEMCVWAVLAVFSSLPFFFLLGRKGIEAAVTDQGRSAITALLTILLPIFVVLVEGTSPLLVLLRRTMPFAFEKKTERVARMERERREQRDARPREEGRVTRTEATWVLLRAMTKRSEKLARDASRRSNIHLLLGASVGLSGLLFFYFMSGPKFLPPVQSATSEAIVGNLANALPRVTILIFVELMAMFFLKQYRAAMEEFRYYEEVLRHREATEFAYLVADDDTTGTALQQLSTSVLANTSFGVLKQGESTAVLEAAKFSENELAGLVRAAAAVLEKAGKIPDVKSGAETKTHEEVKK
jgi:hypothetical protein